MSSLTLHEKYCNLCIFNPNHVFINKLAAICMTDFCIRCDIVVCGIRIAPGTYLQYYSKGFSHIALVLPFSKNNKTISTSIHQIA